MYCIKEKIVFVKGKRRRRRSNSNNDNNKANKDA